MSDTYLRVAGMNSDYWLSVPLWPLWFHLPACASVYNGRMDHRVLSAGLLHDETFRRLCRARDLLAAEYQTKLSLEQAAREACLSPFHFHRLFASAFGETPHDFITHRRLEYAKRLLAAGDMSVTEVCFEVGYSSLGSFSQKFHRLAGRSPSEYQREVKKVFGFRAPWHIVFLPTCYLANFAGLE